MKFWKFLVFLLLSAFYFLPSSVSAQDEFFVDANVIYSVQESGKTLVTHNVTLENNFSNLYATTYTLGLENIDATNVKAESDKGVVFPTEISKDEDITNIKVTFPDSSVGKGTQRHFTITYENSSFAVRTGEVW
ncbi:MAG: hypothetical protein UT96_C0025G0001, partial [Candidatus Woesebacteria bacterium GW2011_GWC2_40_30]